MKNVVACLVAVAATGVAPVQQTDYRFDEVRRNVVLTSANQETKVDRGQRAHGGDKVQTGMFSYALIASDRYRAKFEIFGSTNVQLAEGTPGVILSLERGRLRAMFDKITGTEPRMVQTPGALLAVRGTKYDVEVDRAGQTTVDVWEGIVEVQSPMIRQPMFVRAGEESTFNRHEPPQQSHPIPDNRRMNDPNHHPGADDHHQNPQSPRGEGGQPPSGGPHSGGQEHGQGAPPPVPPPTAPKPPGHH
jgi:hypothetical protein